MSSILHVLPSCIPAKNNRRLISWIFAPHVGRIQENPSHAFLKYIALLERVSVVLCTGHHSRSRPSSWGCRWGAFFSCYVTTTSDCAFCFPPFLWLGFWLGSAVSFLAGCVSSTNFPFLSFLWTASSAWAHLLMISNSFMEDVIRLVASSWIV